MLTRPRSDVWYVLRGVVPVLAVGALIAVLAGGSDTPSKRPVAATAWSAWKPKAHAPLDAAREIANFVAPRYQVDTHARLVNVQPEALAISGTPATVTIQPRPDQAAPSRSFPHATSVAYRFCGLAPDCSITPGAPSIARHLLLRREALELALYTLRYTAVDQVVVFFPHPNPAQPPQAMFFRRSPLRAQLRRALDATIIPDAPIPSEMRHSGDSGVINSITLPLIFTYRAAPGTTTPKRTTLTLEPLVLGTPGGAQPPRPQSPRVQDA